MSLSIPVIPKLEDTKGKLEKTVNMRAMNMLGKAEEQFNDLMRKKTTVENDKAKINKVIKELDVKKKAEIRVAWDKVNKDFGSIFSTLLPGTKAKLQVGSQTHGSEIDFITIKIALSCFWFLVHKSPAFHYEFWLRKNSTQSK